MLGLRTIGRPVVPHLQDWDVQIDWSNPLTDSLALAAFINPGDMGLAPLNYVDYTYGTGSMQGESGGIASDPPSATLGSLVGEQANACGTWLPNAAKFNGSTQWAHLPLDLSVSTAFTVAFWYVKQSGLDIALEYTVDYQSTNGGWVFGPESSPGSTSSFLNHDSNGTGQVYLNSALPNGELHHHIVGMDRSGGPGVGVIRFWRIDGGAADTSSLGTLNAGDPWTANGGLNIAARNSGASFFCPMSMAHLCVWTRLLTIEDATNFYSDTSQIYRPKLPRAYCGMGSAPPAAMSQWFLAMANG